MRSRHCGSLQGWGHRGGGGGTSGWIRRQIWAGWEDGGGASYASNLDGKVPNDGPCRQRLHRGVGGGGRTQGWSNHERGLATASCRPTLQGRRQGRADGRREARDRSRARHAWPQCGAAAARDDLTKFPGEFERSCRKVQLPLLPSPPQLPGIHHQIVPGSPLHQSKGRSIAQSCDY